MSRDHMRIAPISEQNDATFAALLDLNNAHARETSLLTPAEWSGMVDEAFTATCIAGSSALLIAFDQDADYHSPNFKWFCQRYARFVYVDRIIVSSAHRGAGLAGHLYGDLFMRAKQAEHTRVVCEVNLVPPNPGSDAFHSKMGFAEVGRADLHHSAKTVRYLEKHLS